MADKAFINFGDAAPEQKPGFPVTPEKYHFLVRIAVELGERKKAGSNADEDQKEKCLYITFTSLDDQYNYRYALTAPYRKDGDQKKIESDTKAIIQRFQHIYAVMSGRSGEDRPNLVAESWDDYFTKGFKLLTGELTHDGKTVKDEDKRISFINKSPYWLIIGRGREHKTSHKNEIRRYGAIIQQAVKGKDSSLAKGDAQWENYRELDAPVAMVMPGLQQAPLTSNTTSADDDDWGDFGAD